MNISVSAGDGFEAPVAANFTIRFKTPFTAPEIAAATITVECTQPDGTMSQQTAIASGADILLQVTPEMFTAGLWELNPVAVVAGKKYTYPRAVGMNVLARGVSRYPAPGRYAIQ